jgi:hypothetical protein
MPSITHDEALYNDFFVPRDDDLQVRHLDYPPRTYILIFSQILCTRELRLDRLLSPLFINYLNATWKLSEPYFAAI